MLNLILAISNEGWDSIGITIMFVAAAAVCIVYILKTGKWPWG